jgi:hypothetical protein
MGANPIVWRRLSATKFCADTPLCLYIHMVAWGGSGGERSPVDPVTGLMAHKNCRNRSQEPYLM